MANLVDLLAAVDDRLPSERGALVIDDDATRGTVLVETCRPSSALASPPSHDRSNARLRTQPCDRF
jgi:hypothetical protein